MGTRFKYAALEKLNPIDQFLVLDLLTYQWLHLECMHTEQNNCFSKHGQWHNKILKNNNCKIDELKMYCSFFFRVLR